MTGNPDIVTDEISFELFGRNVTVSSSSVQGRRRENQDCIGWFAVTPEGNYGSVDIENKGQEMLFCALCDGMGGMRDGAAASHAVIHELMRWAPSFRGDVDDLFLGVRDVLERTESIMVKATPGTGTTLVILACINGKWCSIHIGDSRCYTVTGNAVERTFDHAPVDEMFREGLIDEDEAMSHEMNCVISAFIGAEDSRLGKLELNLRSVPDFAILCSDGAYGCMKEKDFIPLCRDNSAESIVRGCYEMGSSDNISVIKVSVE